MNKSKKQNWKRVFFTIWTGQAISLITSAVLQMAIVWHLTETTGSAMVLSIATMVGFLPQAILGSMIGVLVDRWNRKAVMIGADIIIALAAAVMAIWTFFQPLPIWTIMLILFIRSIGTAFHSPALNAVTPLIVPEDKLTKCAGYSQSIQSASFILSPAIAAVIFANWGLNAAVGLDILGALLACITVFAVSIPKQQKSAQNQNNFLEEFKDGYGTIKRNKGLYALLWIGVLYCLAFMPINALFPLFCMNYFGTTTTGASVVETLFAIGMLGGSLLLGTWGGFKRRTINISCSIFIMGAALAVSGALPSSAFAVFAVCCTFMGLSAPFYNGILLALIQESIEPEYLGRIFGLLGSMMSLAMPIGLIFSGIFADRIGVNLWFFFSGIFVILIAVLSVSLPSIKNLEK